MFDITPFIIFTNYLLDEFEYESDLYKLRKPIKLVVNPQTYDKAKTELRGIEYRPYNHTCNEQSHFEGRAILVQHGVDRHRGLSGVITEFSVVPLRKSAVREKYLSQVDRHYDQDMPIAEIEYEIADATEYGLIEGVPVPVSALPN